MAKLEVIENLGKIDKKPIWGEGFHYEIQKVKYGEKIFYRRQKIKDGKVSSASYAYEINSKRWISALYEM